MPKTRDTAAASILVTCEHASAAIPSRWRPLFARDQDVLTTHRAWDPGTAEVAKMLARRLQAPLILGRQSRLVVDLNRSPHHPRLFSSWTRPLPDEERERILEHYYRPYRSSVIEWIRERREHPPIIHFSIHSFTPVLAGQVRSTDVGLLYDPARPLEREQVARLQGELKRRLPGGWKVHRNRPYKGVSDGLIPGLRKIFPSDQYAGIEIEMNQRHLATAADRARLGRWIVDSVSSQL